MSLISKNKKRQYRFGDRVVVKVIRASKETSMIDFELMEKETNKLANSNTYSK
jgi:exoribonuclease R